MRPFLPFVLLALALPVSSRAQTACSPEALSQSARTALELRQQMHREKVDALDPSVPSAIATDLQQLKAALADAAEAAFACAEPSATPEELQQTLADALHANLNAASETVIVTRNHKDEGAYGSDLAVQVFPLYSSPKYFEVDFRYGIECGDDNLLLVFRAGAGANAGHWDEVLRWGAPAYNTVSDAFGDFILLTPLSGFPGQRNWRFVVAHGQPSCSGHSVPSHFDLDLLEPSGDPAHPTVAWHIEHPYIRSQEPRLSTTEDTLSFDLAPPDRTSAHRGKPTTSASASFHYRVTRDNHVEPLGASPDAGTPPQSAQSASTHSPR